MASSTPFRAIPTPNHSIGKNRGEFPLATAGGGHLIEREYSLQARVFIGGFAKPRIVNHFLDRANQVAGLSAPLDSTREVRNLTTSESPAF